MLGDTSQPIHFRPARRKLFAHAADPAADFQNNVTGIHANVFQQKIRRANSAAR